MEAIVLAGGLGTRLRTAVSNVPKPMAPVQGRPFLELLLDYWIGQGVRHFILSVGYMADRIVSHFGANWHGAQMQYALESHPLGTGGGLLLAAEKAQGDDLLVMNGDSFFAVEAKEMEQFHAAHRCDWTLALFASDDVKRYTRLAMAADGSLQSAPNSAHGGYGLVNGGVYLLKRQMLNTLPWKAGDACSVENDFLPHAFRAGWRVYGRRFDRDFIDIGVPDDYRRAAEFFT